MGLSNKFLPAGSRRQAVLRRAAHGAFEGLRRLEQWSRPKNLTAAKPASTAEGGKLKRSWAKHRPEDLAEYLVSGYQNPRINAQSILARHFLIRQLFGSEFDDLMREELAFSVETNAAIRARAAELGVSVGVRLDSARRAEIKQVCQVIADREDEFERRWAKTLADRQGGPLEVLEFACGSANDYRFLDSYGIARSLEYTGVDLNDANVANASQMFPGVRFEVQSILDLPYADESFDYVLAFDIFEHLSLEAMEQAMSEAMRVARRGVVIAFFIMVDKPDHNERPKGTYHWNELSADRITELLQKKFPSVSRTHLKPYLASEYGAKTYYNPKAWTLIAEKG